MREKIKLFENAAFIFEGRTFYVKRTKLLDMKAMIFTDKQTFVKYETELDAFLSVIEFIGVEKEEVRKEVIHDVVFNENKIIVYLNNVEILEVNDKAKRISLKLEEAFNSIFDTEFSEEAIKKADAMVRVSNAIVLNEMMRFKYLNMK